MEQYLCSSLGNRPMSKVTAVIAPTDVSTFTYLERSTHKFEQHLLVAARY
jgi:hypothetical protein